MRRLWRLGIGLACLCLPGGCGEDSPVADAYRDCDVITHEPATCYLADSIDFGIVSIGDTAHTSFYIGNWDGSIPRSPFTVSIDQSPCPQFNWESGRRSVEPFIDEYFGVTFQPDSAGPFRCSIIINPASCRSVQLVGVGTHVQRPPLLAVKNWSQHEARFTVSYHWGDSTHVESRELTPFEYPFQPGSANHVDLPVDAIDIELHAETANGEEPNPWTTVFRQTFPEPVRNYYMINFKGFSPAWKKVYCYYYPTCSSLAPIEDS
jgi:hypothetical protein